MTLVMPLIQFVQTTALCRPMREPIRRIATLPEMMRRCDAFLFAAATAVQEQVTRLHRLVRDRMTHFGVTFNPTQVLGAR